MCRQFITAGKLSKLRKILEDIYDEEIKIRLWGEIEDEEKERLGSSNKPIIAKAVANRITNSEKLPDDIGWNKFIEIVEMVKNL
mgnify:CR=1 FL=1